MSRTIFKPFGPSVLKVKMSEDLIKKLNDYTDEKSKETKEGDKLDAGYALAGNVSQEIYLDEKFMTESGFGKFLFTEVSNWISQTKKKTNKKISNISIMDSKTVSR